MDSILPANMISEMESQRLVMELKKQVYQNEIMTIALWSMLKDKGYTSDELAPYIEKAVELKNRKDFKIVVKCPNCGKPMQQTVKDPFKCKCMYCEAEVLTNPYDMYESMPEVDNESVAPVEEETEVDPMLEQFEPYDVTKDLKFDEEDN